MGAALITMFWVSVAVLILDAWAMLRAWQFAIKAGTRSRFSHRALRRGCRPRRWYTCKIKFLQEQRKRVHGTHHRGALAQCLHGLLGNDSLSMLTVSRTVGTDM
jgi:hypothetical protein